MADIGFLNNINGGFTVSFSDNPTLVRGNRALANRFEITLLTNTRRYLLGDSTVVDDYGGDAEKYISQPRVLNNPQGIASALSVAVEKTVEAILSTQSEDLDPTEKLESAEMLDLEIINDTIYARIKVVPIEAEQGLGSLLTLPIRGV